MLLRPAGPVHASPTVCRPPVAGPCCAVGTANLAVSYTNITCSLPSSSSGTPGWVWAVVGVAAALALAAGGVAALLWRRRRRLASQQQQAVLPLEGKPGEGASTSGDTPDLEGQRGAAGAEEGGALSPFALSAHQRLGSAPASSNNTLSPLSSSIGKLPSMEVPETMWRSRVGFIEGLKIGGMIGRGGFAEVYRGTWHGTPVAVKVVRTHVGPGHQLDLSREPMLRSVGRPLAGVGGRCAAAARAAAVPAACATAHRAPLMPPPLPSCSMSVAHPNVIASYKMCVVKLLMDNGAPPPATPGGSELSPAGSGLSSSNPSGNPSGSRLVASVTGKGCLAEVMPLEAVLSPG